MHQQAPVLSEPYQDELERRVFHLKTLYEVSQQLLGVAEAEPALRNFLLMFSARCRHLPLASDSCPGRISACRRAGSPAGCRDSGGTTFRAIFAAGSG